MRTSTPLRSLLHSLFVPSVARIVAKALEIVGISKQLPIPPVWRSMVNHKPVSFVTPIPPAHLAGVPVA